MEPLKNMYSEAFIQKIADKLTQLDDTFQIEKFHEYIYQEDWEDLKLLERSNRVADAMHEMWKDTTYEEVATKLVQVQEEENGLAYVFLPHYVGKYGLDNFGLSFKLLETLTAGSTGEFAIRNFMQKDCATTIDQMVLWSEYPDEHIRRLASEGTRTKLPWAIKVKELDNYIPEIIGILENLKHDESLYVRKSVANSINDLSKDYPEIILPLMVAWKKENNPKLDWIIKRGLRTLLKKGNVEAQQILGYDNDVTVEAATISVDSEAVSLGEATIFDYQIALKTNKTSKVRVQYEVAYIKKHGTSNKRFFLLEKLFEADTIITGNKQHQWKDLTTRKHYAGTHEIAIIVNGERVAKTIVNLRTDIDI